MRCPATVAESVGSVDEIFIESAAEELLEELEEIDELVEAAETDANASAAQETRLEEITLDPEEVSLNFLEEEVLEPGEAGVSPDISQPKIPVDVELELELDMDLDFETDGASVDLEKEKKNPDYLSTESAVVSDEGAGEDFFDLGAEILEFDDLELETALGEEVPEQGIAAEQAPPKKRVKTGTEVEDPESHYNLGIAYKEMGLLDDAIGEFEKAMLAPERTVASLVLKGMCLMEKGEGKKAEETFKVGLSNAGIDESGRVSLQYELGVLYENSEQLLEALECFQFVTDRDLFYRDAGERAAELRRRLGLDDSSGNTGAGCGKNRVSYV